MAKSSDLRPWVLQRFEISGFNTWQEHELSSTCESWSLLLMMTPARRPGPVMKCRSDEMRAVSTGSIHAMRRRSGRQYVFERIGGVRPQN